MQPNQKRVIVQQALQDALYALHHRRMLDSVLQEYYDEHRSTFESMFESVKIVQDNVTYETD